jgi:hypothetical protein
MASKKLSTTEALILLIIAYAVLHFIINPLFAAWDTQQKENEDMKLIEEAVSQNNILLCEQKMNFYYDNLGCVSDLVSLNENFLCDQLSNKNLKYQCYVGYAFKNRDFTVCAESPEPDICYTQLCGVGIKEACNKIQSESLRKEAQGGATVIYLGN